MSGIESTDEDEVKSDTEKREKDEQIAEATSTEETNESSAANSQRETENNPRERDKEQSEDELQYEPLLDESTERTDEEQNEPAAMDDERLRNSNQQSDATDVAQQPSEPQQKPSDRDSQELKEHAAEAEAEETINTPTPSPSINSDQQQEQQAICSSPTPTAVDSESRFTFEIKQETPINHLSTREGQTSRDDVYPPNDLVCSTASNVVSQPSYPVSQLTDQVASMSVNTSYGPPRRAKPTQSALYRRQPTTQSSNQPWYIKPNYCISPQPPPNTSSYAAPTEPRPYNDYQPQPPVYVAPVPPTTTTPAAPPPQPTRKLSATSPYVGSQVIASETGPSLTILLRRPTSERHWGFTFYGGSEYGCPPFVNKVNNGSLALQYGIEVGDVIVSICNSLTVGKTQEQLKADILRAGNELDLVLIRRGVDLEKISQVAPQALFASPRSPTPSSGSQNKHFTFPATPRPDAAVTRSRSFRSIKTKSIRILEEQLASGQTPSSVIQTKQHFQGARGLPATGASSTIARAYGQSPNQGYLGRQPTAGEPTSRSVWISGEAGQPVQYAQPVYAPYEPSHSSDRGTVQWDQASVGQPSWDVQSYAGQSSGWATPRPTYVQPTVTQQVYPVQVNSNPTYNPRIAAHSPPASITIPVQARIQWPNRPM